VSIPEYCIALLRSLRKEQIENQLKIGTLWHDENWLFARWNGLQKSLYTPTGWFPDFLKRHGLPHMKFHALRHTSATLLLISGNNLKSVSSRLRHVKLETTNRYLHALKTADVVAAETFNEMFCPKVDPDKRRTNRIGSFFCPQ
jgi:integrase